MEKINHPAVEKRFKTAQEALTALSIVEREENSYITKNQVDVNDFLVSDRI